MGSKEAGESQGVSTAPPVRVPEQGLHTGLASVSLGKVRMGTSVVGESGVWRVQSGVPGKPGVISREAFRKASDPIISHRRARDKGAIVRRSADDCAAGSREVTRPGRRGWRRIRPG